jgi:hypothetical protein
LLARGERDGFPMIVRMAAAFRGLGGVPGYDHHVIVGASLREPTPAGLPSTGEGDDLERFETNLCQALETDNETRCVLVITNQGIRDFIFYTRNPQGVKTRLDATVPKLKGFKFNVAIEPDENWRIYQAFDKWLTPAPARLN